MVERVLELDVAQLVVPDARRAMARAAVVFFEDPTTRLEVAGVTGTNGKTTTTFLLHSILAAAGRQPGLLGTIESRIGGERRPAIRTTPEAIDLQRAFHEMLDADDRSCALEATSHGSELGRLDGVRFAALAFTNLGQDHLDFHGTFERYFAAKRRLFVEGERPPAAVNVGDEHGRRLAEELRALGHERLLTFGLVDEADIRPEQLELDGSGARLRAGGIELRTTRSQQGSRRSRGSPAGSRRSKQASRSRSSSITRTSRTPSRTSFVPPMSSHAIGLSASSVAAATGTGPNGR